MFVNFKVAPPIVYVKYQSVLCLIDCWLSSENLSLEQRITYLAKAVLCLRSDQVGCAPHLGVFLHELEDYLQVANVQKKVSLDVPDKSNSMVLNGSEKVQLCTRYGIELFIGG